MGFTNNALKDLIGKNRSIGKLDHSMHVLGKAISSRKNYLSR